MGGTERSGREDGVGGSSAGLLSLGVCVVARRFLRRRTPCGVSFLLGCLSLSLFPSCPPSHIGSVPVTRAHVPLLLVCSRATLCCSGSLTDSPTKRHRSRT